MPTYAYRCDRCGERRDVRHSALAQPSVLCMAGHAMRKDLGAAFPHVSLQWHKDQGIGDRLVIPSARRREAMPIPATPVAPGDDGYEALYLAWERGGRPGMMDDLAAGTLYRAYRLDAASHDPTFVLACAAPNLGVVLGTWQNSWRGRRPLPVE
jgi:hypothetical protein